MTSAHERLFRIAYWLPVLLGLLSILDWIRIGFYVPRQLDFTRKQRVRQSIMVSHIFST